jgi:hypothetical protein
MRCYAMFKIVQDPKLLPKSPIIAHVPKSPIAQVPKCLRATLTSEVQKSVFFKLKKSKDKEPQLCIKCPNAMRQNFTNLLGQGRDSGGWRIVITV